jgi:hypothetical protein
MKRIQLALIIVGGVLIYFGIQEMRLAGTAKSVPQTITCAELAAQGPGDNAHVILTDFEIGQNLVYQTSGRNNSAWQVAYLPAMPKARASSLSREIVKPDANPAVIIKSRKISGEKDILALGDKVQGLVINKIASLGQKEKDLLAEHYSRGSVENCWIIEHDRRPAGGLTIFGFLAGGLALAALGLVWFLSGRRAA